LADSAFAGIDLSVGEPTGPRRWTGRGAMESGSVRTTGCLGTVAHWDANAKVGSPGDSRRSAV